MRPAKVIACGALVLVVVVAGCTGGPSREPEQRVVADVEPTDRATIEQGDVFPERPKVVLKKSPPR